MSIEFLLTTLVIVATPGTGVVYTLSAGLSRGARASVVAANGCTLDIVPHVLAAITGLAALLHASAVAFQTIKYIGVLYLLYMAWVTLKEKDAIVVVRSDSNSCSSMRVVVSGILINILNPKLTIFFFAFLPQFVDSDRGGAIISEIELSAIFMLFTLAVFIAYGWLAAAVRDHVISRPRVLTWLRRCNACSFVALSARLAVTNRWRSNSMSNGPDLPYRAPPATYRYDKFFGLSVLADVNDRGRQGPR